MARRAQLDDDDDARAHAEVVRIARALHRREARVLGLLPTGPTVPVPPLATRLAVALHQVGGAPTAMVDGNLRWPSASITEDDGTSHDLLFVRHWLQPGVALIAPRQQGPAGAGVPQLRLLVRATRDLFGYLVIDLTGYAELGDHVEVMEVTDRVLLVAAAGVTRESELVARHAAVPEAKSLGVILVG